MNASTDARLDSKSGICFKKQGSPYYTIDLGSTIDLYGIQMAGHATIEAWVTRYDVQLLDEDHNVVLTLRGLKANVNNSAIVQYDFLHVHKEPHYLARYVRLLNFETDSADKICFRAATVSW